MNYNELNFEAMTRERDLAMSAAFPVLMRKVYVWMTTDWRDGVWCGFEPGCHDGAVFQPAPVLGVDYR